MGIWERPPAWFHRSHAARFGFALLARDGLD